MKISLRTAFPSDHVSDAYTDPLGIYASAIAEAGARFDSANRQILRTLTDASASHIVLPDAFRAELIDVATPTAMNVEVLAVKPAQIATISLFAAADLQPISYASENGGLLTVNIVPQPAGGDDQVSFEKSTKELSGHTDAVYFPSRSEFLAGASSLSCSPDFVALACVRNPALVPTKLALLSDIVQLLSDDDQQELTRRIFIIRPQSSFDLPFASWRLGPVLWREDAGTLCCRFSHSKISVDASLYPKAANALRNFSMAVARSYQSFPLKPGEILLFNNKIVVHGRGAIGGEWSPESRWLLRTYANKKGTPLVATDPRHPWRAA
jgi:hypothetical protein